MLIRQGKEARALNFVFLGKGGKNSIMFFAYFACDIRFFAENIGFWVMEGFPIPLSKHFDAREIWLSRAR
jgi:hypothetical protein